jgi:hypothetical protein
LGPLRKFGRAGGGVDDFIERAGEPIEVVYHARLGVAHHAQASGIPVRRYAQDRLGFRDDLR